MQVTYRIAQTRDAEDLFRFLVRMHRENGLASLAPKKTYRKIMHMFEHGFVLLAMDTEIVGSIGAEITDCFWYSEDQVCGDSWMYVAEARHDRGFIARRLIEGLRLYAQAMGVPLITGPVTPTNLKRKTEFYCRLGLRPVGTLFMET